MARSIVLRFDATCVDCGSLLPAGTTARWFGKGRVSCCGGPSAAQSPSATARPGADAFRPAPPALPPSASPSVRKFVAETADAIEAARRSRIELEAARLGVEAERMFCGLSPADVATLAVRAPTLLLLVRLSSGARLVIPAEHTAHVLRCIEESLVDRVRDVTRSPLNDKGGA